MVEALLNALGDNMKKETYSVFGDSISTFEGFIADGNRVYYEAPQTEATGVVSASDTWWMQVIKGMDGEFLTNASFSGSMVSGCAFPAGCSKERAEQLLTSNGSAPNNVLVFIGINDYGWGSADAQVAGRSEAMPRVPELTERIPESTAGVAPDDAIAEFEGSYRTMLRNILAVVAGTVSDAKIWCITLLPGRVKGCKDSTFCYQLRGKGICEYNDAICRAAQEYGCYLADIAAFGYDYEATDGTHPTKRGMQQLSQLVLAAMKGKPELVTQNEDLFPDYMRSSQTCEKSTCIGCEYAQSTGNKWSCICRKLLPE